MEWIIGLVAVAFLIWMYYQITQRIGIEQSAAWEQFKKDHPDWFAKPEEAASKGTNWTDEQKKSTLTKCGQGTESN